MYCPNFCWRKKGLIKFLKTLYSPSYAVTTDRVDIIVPSKKKIIVNSLEIYWANLERYNPALIDLSFLPRFEFPLKRVAEKEKSNLNVFFGKGRENKKTLKITPRPWHKIELIASNDLNSQEFYPKGDFLAYTDDGILIPMSTQGDYHKNIRSKKSLQILEYG